METQTDTSKQIVDHRKVASHGATALLGLIVGVLCGGSPPVAPAADVDHDLVQLVSTALDRGQDFWADKLGTAWRMAHVVLIDSDERTACGVASKATGPFYCPPSERVYVDLSFLRAIKGDLARAYVIAHELGHHVQRVRSQLTGRKQVDVELQADCYAGMWMRTELALKHASDAELGEALEEAAAVGDDRLAPGSSPESWTHGSSAQRVASLQAGFGGSPCSI